MAASIKNVILVGAGGNLGKTVLDVFLAAKAFNVTVLSRENSTSVFPSEVKVIKTDYTPASLQSGFTGQDAVVSIVGNGGFGDQVKFIDAAIAAGVKRIVPSEFGSNTADEKVRKIVPIFAGKKQVVDYLTTKESQISWTALITGPFADWGFNTGFLGFNVKERKATIYDKGVVPVSISNLAQIGRALISVLQHPAETANKYVYVSSATVTQKDVLAAFEKATGAKWAVEELEVPAVIEASTKKLQAGDFSGIGGLILGAAYGNFPDGPYGDWNKVGSWNEKLGLKEENLDDIVKSVL